MGIITWIAIGAVLGFVFSLIAGRHNTIANVAVGLVGGFAAGWIATFFGLGSIGAFGLWSALVSAGGAVVLLLLFMLVQRGKA